MYDPNSSSPEMKDLNLHVQSFWVAKFDIDKNDYVQYGHRMSPENATKMCKHLRETDHLAEYKVFCELEF